MKALIKIFSSKGVVASKTVKASVKPSSLRSSTYVADYGSKPFPNAYYNLNRSTGN
jgi:hypothetical protein